jgi:hypothetical protein
VENPWQHNITIAFRNLLRSTALQLTEVQINIGSTFFIVH